VTKFLTLINKNAAVVQSTTRRLGSNAVVQSTITVMPINVVIIRILFPARIPVRFINILSELQ
jgi:hypothetical protein